ncbi:MAG: head GIN domain-containing protein [Flavobacteriaceae bacterium]
MKTLSKLTLTLALTLFGFTQMDAQWGQEKVVGNGNITTKSVTTGNYDEIKLVGSIDVHLEKGTEGNISVTTDENLQEYISIEVNGGELVIKTKRNYYLKTKHGVHVTVPFQDLSEVSLTGSGDMDSKDTIKANDFEVSLTGSGDITLTLDAQMVDTDITGSGDITLLGTTNNLKVNVTGSGDFRGFDLQANHTEVRVSGSGDAKVVAKQSLNARVNGSGDITYKGNPEKSDTKTSGSGDISSF